MPILLPTLPDPSGPLIAGEQMRVAGDVADALQLPVLLPQCSAPKGFFSLVADEDMYLSMNSFVETNRLSIRRMKNLTLQIRNNAGIVSPTGAWIFNDYTPLLNQGYWTTDTFTISGTTYTGAGVALANCRVVVYETGRIAVDSGIQRASPSAGNPFENSWASESPVVGETVSDGSGNFSITVPMNVAYQLTGYKSGTPVAGITADTVTPGTVNIYLRDPTALDPAGGASYRPVGSPIVRRLQ